MNLWQTTHWRLRSKSLSSLQPWRLQSVWRARDSIVTIVQCLLLVFGGQYQIMVPMVGITTSFGPRMIWEMSVIKSSTNVIVYVNMFLSDGVWICYIRVSCLFSGDQGLYAWWQPRTRSANPAYLDLLGIWTRLHDGIVWNQQNLSYLFAITPQI